MRFFHNTKGWSLRISPSCQYIVWQLFEYQDFLTVHDINSVPVLVDSCSSKIISCAVGIEVILGYVFHIIGAGELNPVDIAVVTSDYQTYYLFSLWQAVVDSSVPDGICIPASRIRHVYVCQAEQVSSLVQIEAELGIIRA